MQYSINLRSISDNRQCFLRCNIFLNCSLLFLMTKEGSALKNIRENYDPIANKNYNNFTDSFDDSHLSITRDSKLSSLN